MGTAAVVTKDTQCDVLHRNSLAEANKSIREDETVTSRGLDWWLVTSYRLIFKVIKNTKKMLSSPLTLGKVLSTEAYNMRHVGLGIKPKCQPKSVITA